jgi:hypothetical protein
MLSILTIDIFLVRLLSKIITAGLSSKSLVQPKRARMPANSTMTPLPQPQTARLDAAPSVTEGTTRFFEPYRAPVAVNDRTTSEKLER